MKPDCFGELAKVFPERPDGLRQSPPECLACEAKVECLRSALLTPEGAGVEQGGLSRRTAVGRVMKGFRRWSALKSDRLTADRRKRPSKGRRS